jgi:UbiD family decarboxylase
LRVIRNADWDLEIGTICELNYERKGPALLFDDIKDYPSGYRVLAESTWGVRRAMISLGLPPETSVDEGLAEYERRVAAYKPVPPVEVQDGPVYENSFFGDNVDLLKFPTPRWHEEDGGRYIGTGCVVYMRDPDTGKVNFGTYRVMLQDRNTVGLYITPNKTGAIIRRKYWERGQSCPVAVSFGHEPYMFLGGSQVFGQKRGLIKYEMVGHMRGAPVEVVREEVTGLPVPATAEIVIAGECPPPGVEARAEGPFGEWTGYYGSAERAEPVIRVQALYHRNNPIILGEPPMKTRGGASPHFGIPTGVGNLREHLKRVGVEDVLDVWHLATPGVLVVQIKQRYPGHATKAGLAASGDYMGRFVVVVDEDINPRDPEDVLWAIGTRCDPATTLSILPPCQSSVLDPRIPPDRKAKGDLTSSRAIINACKPFEWKDQFPKTNIASPELRKQVRAKWKDLLGG